MAIIVLRLVQKTGSDTWTQRASENNPAAGGYSLNYTFASTGVTAIKSTAEDDSGNTSDSNVVLFENLSTRVVSIASITDDTEPGTGSLTTNFAHTNDITPTLNMQLPASDLSIYGETASVPVGTITEIKIWMAWKPYITPETAATINYTQDGIGSHATVGGTGQVAWTLSSGFSKVGSNITFSSQYSNNLLSNRIYTFGVKWKDSVGVWSTNPSSEFSICIDTSVPVVDITTPVNGYIYNGQITVVTGNVSDPA